MDLTEVNYYCIVRYCTGNEINRAKRHDVFWPMRVEEAKQIFGRFDGGGSLCWWRQEEAGETFGLGDLEF